MPAAHAADVAGGGGVRPGYCIDELGEAFREEVPEPKSGWSVGASGKLLAQIKRGAPFDVFLSADMDYPRRLAAKARPTRPRWRPYAMGKLAVWSLDERFDLGRACASSPTRAWRAWPSPIRRWRRMAAPRGRRAAVRAWRLGTRCKAGWCRGRNVAQAESSRPATPSWESSRWRRCCRPAQGRGRYTWCRKRVWRRSRRAAIVTRRGQGNPLAGRFVRFLQTEERAPSSSRRFRARGQDGGASRGYRRNSGARSG